MNNQQGATRDLQQELLNVLGDAHIQPDPKKTDQLLTALRALLLSRKNPFADIKSDGTVKTALENLGLGETINKASGAMQKSANGADISDVSAFRNALQLGTAATRDVGADNASKLLDLDSFRSMMSGNGYIYIPCIATTGNPVKLMLQWGTVATQKGVDAGYALPFAFPYAG
ncbi:TPA: phage tail protein, partial [Escherichia coli]